MMCISLPNVCVELVIFSQGFKSVGVLGSSLAVEEPAGTLVSGPSVDLDLTERLLIRGSGRHVSGGR